MLETKVMIVGSKGLVGSAFVRRFQAAGYENLLSVDRSIVHLCDAAAVRKLFEAERPDWVILAAAKVGGIYANSTYPADFLLDNLKIQNNVIESAYACDVRKLLFLGSSCIYPKLAPQPLREDALLTSSLEPSNEAYAIAKIAGLKLCGAFNRQYGTNYLCVMPTNLYGINDNYHVKNAHVIPMLLRRFYEAKLASLSGVVVWGTGTPKREFMCSDDLADAGLFLMENYDAKDVGEFINVGTGTECTIAELIELIKEVVDYKGRVIYDSAQPDGTPRKIMDSTRINTLGWRPKVTLREGLKLAYADFLENPSTRL